LLKVVGKEKSLTGQNLSNDTRTKERMKVSSVFALCFLASQAVAFSPSCQTACRSSAAGLTRQHMFGGAGEGTPTEDNPEEIAQMEAAAKSMGMSVSEYQLGLNARNRLTTELNEARVSSGNADTVLVERDANNPPKHLEITITDAAKSQGAEGVSKELVAALKGAADEGREKRMAAQKGMMDYIGEEMKKLQ